MSEKSSILSDYFGKILLKEVKGISFEVRAWAQIIKDVVDGEYKKYLDSYREQSMNRFGGMSFGPNTNSQFANRDMQYMDQDDDWWYGLENMNTGPITEKDLAVMNQREIDDILDVIMHYHKELAYHQIIDLKPPEIVKLYNQTLLSEAKNIFIPDDKPTIERPTQIIINGKDYPEAFANFSVDKWVISDNQPSEYDHIKSGYQDNGEYTVFINCSMNDVSLFILTHEVKHAYQDWQRISKNKPPIRDSKELQQLYTKDFEKFLLSHRTNYQLQLLDSVIAAYYMSSNAEITAYLEGAYDEIQLKHKIPVASLYELGLNMVKFNAHQVEINTPPESLQKRWVKIITEYDIPLFRKFKNVFDFLKYTEKRFNKTGRYIVKKVDKLRTIEQP